MAKKTTQVWALIQQYMDSQLVRVSQAGVAAAVGVERSALSQWKYGQATPRPEHLRSLQRVTRIPYRLFLDALLVDMGYLDAEEMMGNAQHPAAIVRQSDDDSGTAPSRAPVMEAEVEARDDSDLHEPSRGAALPRPPAE